MIKGSAGAAPPGDYASWDDYMNDAALAVGYDRRLCSRLSKAMRLAPSIAVFGALLEGQQVPVEALDPVWARRYRL